MISKFLRKKTQDKYRNRRKLYHFFYIFDAYCNINVVYKHELSI